MAVKQFSIRIPSDLDELNKLRKFIQDIGKSLVLSEDDLNTIELVIYEACANSIEHAHRYEKGKYIDIIITIKDSLVRITITDSGKPFDINYLNQIKVGDIIKKKRKRGLGIPLIKTLMDEVVFDYTPEGRNRIKMVKDFS
jgi:anti-sigma regulatory factor (Ser/Thr protein kinase)